MAQLLITWCAGWLAVLKLLQMLCLGVVVLFLLEGRSQWAAYTLIFLCAIALGILSFLTLIAYFLQIQKSAGTKHLPWTSFEFAFNLIATVLCAAFAAILVYDYVRMSGEIWHHHRHLPPKNIGRSVHKQT